MALGAVDAEIGGGGARRREFRADAGSAGMEFCGIESRPNAGGGGGEGRVASGIDGVVDTIYPFDVGAETGLTREIEGEMRAQTARFGDGVDQVGEGRAAGIGEIGAAGEVLRRHMGGVERVDGGSQAGGGKAGGIDQARGQHDGIVLAFDPDQPECLAADDTGDTGAASKGGAVGLCAGQQGLQVGVRIEDAGGRRQQRLGAGERGFEVVCCGTGEVREVVDAVGRRGLGDGVEHRYLAVVGGEDEFSQALERYLVLFAEGVEAVFAFHAEAGFEGAGGIIEAGVDDFAVARAGP